MKRYLFIPTCAFLPWLVMAQQPTELDSIETQKLEEVVIEASNQRTSSKITTYIPMARQKNAAADAVSLLNQMAIPQLVVNPSDMSVQTVSGQEVSIFIDYVAATEQDLRGMRTMDVNKVEYLIYPTDPRFRGIKYVIHFVMQKYAWGGYTKLHADKWFGVNRTESSVYSKFAYKRMTFDLYADEVYLTNRHTGAQSAETLHSSDLFGNGAQTIQRTSIPTALRYRSNNNDVAFRALYNTDNLQISNKLSFACNSNPRNDTETLLTYALDFMPSSTVRTVSSDRDWNLDYQTEIYRSFSDKLGLDIEADYRYGHDSSHSDYAYRDFRIINNAKEQVHRVSITPNLLWNPDENNSLMPFVHAEYSITHINYFGNSPSNQKYDIGGYIGGLQYMYQRQQGSVGGLLAWVYADVNLSGIRIRDNYPQGNLFATYSPNDQQQVELAYAFCKLVPKTYQKSPTMLQQDELMWYAGTPQLDNFWNHHVVGTYTWLPNNTWQLALNGTYFLADNRVAALYTPTAPDGTMLCQYHNNGNFSRGTVSANITAKIFGGKLVAQIHPSYTRYMTTGEYEQQLNDLFCKAQLTGYWGDFYLSGWYGSPTKKLNHDSGVKERIPSCYQIQAGYSKGGWQVSVTAYNFLRSSWESSREILASPYYQLDRRTYDTTQHMRFQFAVTYTFSYGKKVQRTDEISGTGSVDSAIMRPLSRP